MTPQSAKSKGRSLQRLIVKAICARFPVLIEDQDVCSRSMGATGMDIILSPQARKLFPFSIEARNQQAVNIWKTWEDAKRHGVKESLAALAIIHRNHSDVLVVLDLPTFLAILKTDGEPQK